MQYQRRNTIYICCQQQKYPVSLMGICVLYRRDPLTQSPPDSILCHAQCIRIGHREMVRRDALLHFLSVG